MNSPKALFERALVAMRDNAQNELWSEVASQIKTKQMCELGNLICEQWSNIMVQGYAYAAGLPLRECRWDCLQAIACSLAMARGAAKGKLMAKAKALLKLLQLGEDDRAYGFEVELNKIKGTF